MYFIGVTTAQSSMMRIFPLWMQALKRTEVILRGVDLPMHDDPANYRRLVAMIKKDATVLGALVTTHKLDLFEAAFDLFDELDPYAELCSEVSSISKLEGRLVGCATDPITSGRTLYALIGDHYFGKTGGHVLCLGAGGAALATALHLVNRPHAADRPQRFTFVDIDEKRLSQAHGLVATLHTDIHFDYLHHVDSAANDALLATLPTHSLVINATGMGKDRPGSPLTAAALFPEQGVVWEFNYRGELEFLRQAQAQQQARHLSIADGWLYFLYGWAAVIEHVLHLQIAPPCLARLSEIAAAAR
jgi:shikimate 5-dehydrogenase